MNRVMAALLLLGAASANAAPSTIAGEWWTPGFNARVRIEPCGDAVCGRIVWLWDDHPKSIADKAPLIGRTVIDRMVAAEPTAGTVAACTTQRTGATTRARCNCSRRRGW